MSRRQVRREWSLGDYLEQLDYWNDVPPPHISLALIARSHGANFGSGRSRPMPAGDTAPQQTDPAALMAQFGQSEPLPYRPPQRGLSIH